MIEQITKIRQLINQQWSPETNRETNCALTALREVEAEAHIAMKAADLSDDDLARARAQLVCVHRQTPDHDDQDST